MTDTAALEVLPDAGMVAEATADRFVGIARDAIEARGVFRVALSGGGTPKRVYPLLLDRPRVRAVDWGAVEFFWGDERAVPPDHPESNFGVAYQMLIAQLPGVRNDRIHRMAAESSDLDGAALTYESEIRLAFDARGEAPPAFDLDLARDGARTATPPPCSPAAPPSTSSTAGWSATTRRRSRRGG